MCACFLSKSDKITGQEEYNMGVLGKVAAVKAVKGRREDKKEKKGAEKTEEKK